MRKRILFAVSLALLLLFSPPPASADTPAEMLEKAIYNEETVGNLEEAIRIYRQVVSDAKETRAIAAQAQYRLGQCLLKQGKTSDATAAFEELIQNFPKQTDIVAKAKKHLPEALKLLPAPWEDGERLTLTLKLASGVPLGIIGLGIDSNKEADRNVWQMVVRRYISGGFNQGVSQITVDQATNRPLRTHWDHTILGIATADWQEEKLSIKMKGKADQETSEKSVELADRVFANDQMFYGFRQLPLAVGYKVTVPLRVAFTGGNAVGLEVTVSQMQSFQTPAGSFECFQLDTNIGQTFWIADVPQRYLVRFEAEGIAADLTDISRREEKQITNEDLGFSATVPAGWFSYDVSTTNEKTSAGVNMIAPGMGSATLSVRTKQRLDTEERESPRAWADSKIRTAKDFVSDLQLRSGSMRETTLVGAAGVTFTLEHPLGGRNSVNTASLVFKGEKAIDFTASATIAMLEEYRDEFEAIRQSISVE